MYACSNWNDANSNVIMLDMVTFDALGKKKKEKY
jgi:hypothetical protein